MDQVYRLLRAQCVYCHRFRLPRKDVHRFVCIFRLLQYGLLREAQMIDSIDQNDSGPAEEEEGDEDDDEHSGATDPTIRKRDAFVRKALSENRNSINLDAVRRRSMKVPLKCAESS